MVSPSDIAGFLRAVKTDFQRKNVTFLAGSVAYYAFVSLLPLLLFFILAFAFIGVGWQDRFLALLTQNVSPTIGQFIERILRQNTDGASGSSLIGFVVLVWSALKLFRGLDTAFAIIYEVDADSSFLDQMKDGVIVFVSVVLAVAGIIAATSLFRLFADTVPYLGLLLPLLLMFGLIVAFFPMYYFFPNVDVSAVEVLPGVVIAAFGWALLQGVFQLYVAVSTGGTGTNLLTGIMLLVTWMYFSGIVMLLGAVVNALLGGYSQGRVGINQQVSAETG